MAVKVGEVPLVERISHVLDKLKGPLSFNEEALSVLLIESHTEINDLIGALHDAIQQPVGIVPKSAARWYTPRIAKERITKEKKQRRLEEIDKAFDLEWGVIDEK